MRSESKTTRKRQAMRSTTIVELELAESMPNFIPLFERAQSQGSIYPQLYRHGRWEVETRTSGATDRRRQNCCEDNMSQPPFFNSVPNLTFNENINDFLWTVGAIDPDGGPITYELLPTLDANQFYLPHNGHTGTISFISPPDYENPTDVGGDNIYNIIIQATDIDGQSATQAIQIEVLDLVGN